MTTETPAESRALPPAPVPAPTGSRDPGAKQATGTLAEMLLAPVRDVMALADRPISALAVAPREPWLSDRLLELGVSSVATWGSPPEWRSSDPFDVVIVDTTDPELGSESELLAAARAEGRGICLILSAAAGASGAAAREAGFAKVSLIEPAADAERRYVLHERSLLVAWGEREA